MRNLAQNQLQLRCGLEQDLQALHEASTLSKVGAEGNARVHLQGIGIVGYLNVLHYLIESLHRCCCQLQIREVISLENIYLKGMQYKLTLPSRRQS